MQVKEGKMQAQQRKVKTVELNGAQNGFSLLGAAFDNKEILQVFWGSGVWNLKALSYYQHKSA